MDVTLLGSLILNKPFLFLNISLGIDSISTPDRSIVIKLGILFLMLPLLAVDIVLGILNTNWLASFTEGVWNVAWLVIPQLIFGVVITAIVYLLSFPIAKLTRAFRR